MTSPSGERPPLRIGTSEREAAYAALSEHLEAGRLDAEEFGERYGAASVARTRPELEALFVDLPAPHPAFDPAQTPSWATATATARPRPYPLHRVRAAALRLLVFLPLLVIGTAVATGAWFLLFVIPASMAVLGRGRRGFCGPGWGRRDWAR